MKSIRADGRTYAAVEVDGRTYAAVEVDGRTYAAVEVDENITCEGCIFYTVSWDLSTPECTAVNIPEIQCDANYREDGKNVIFKLMANNVTEE